MNAACHLSTYFTHLCPPDRRAKKCSRPSATTVIWSFQQGISLSRARPIYASKPLSRSKTWMLRVPRIPITPVSVKKLKHIAGGVSGTTTHFDDTTELAHKYLIIGTGSVTNCQYEHMCSYQWLSSDHGTTLQPCDHWHTTAHRLPHVLAAQSALSVFS